MATSLRFVLIVLVLAIVAAGAFAVYMLHELNDDGPRPAIGGIESFVAAHGVKMAPHIEFLDEDGEKLTLEAFRGRIVLLNLWATWCTPCVAEMPTLDRLQEMAAGHGVVVLALSLDSGGAKKVREFYDENGIENLDVYVDPTMRAQNDFGVLGLPTTILIDREGRDRGRVSGPVEWDEERALDVVIRADKPPSP
jgi:thiol-disulfide isomerase/thioredoxin